jgi:hypothetical protein
MNSEDAIRAGWKAQGLRIKRHNLLAALLSGSFLVAVSVRFFPPSVFGVLCGLVLGFFYANGFEYCLHRFVLHAGRGVFFEQHMVHHNTLHAPEAPRYVNFSSNPWGVVALFLANGAPFLALQWIFHNTWTAGMFASFALYYIAFEEIHWRTHMGGWLPGWLRGAARHHMVHHARDTGSFNVFLPIFDWLVAGVHPRGKISQNVPGR